MKGKKEWYETEEGITEEYLRVSKEKSGRMRLLGMFGGKLMKSIYCPNCGWRQRSNVTMTTYSGNGHHDIVYSFRCEYCEEKIRAELQDTKTGDML